jgi:hypothetical protein
MPTLGNSNTAIVGSSFARNSDIPSRFCHVNVEISPGESYLSFS